MPKKLLQKHLESFFGGEIPDFISTSFSLETLEINTNLIEITNSLLKFRHLERIDQNLVILITGLSGAGKDSISQELADTGEFELVINTTSRIEIREGETKNFPYKRLKKRKFKKRIRRGHFLEWVKYSGNFYGTNLGNLREVQKKGKIPVLRVDPAGNQNILELWQKDSRLKDLKIISFFAITESWQSIIDRLNNRDLLSQPEDKRALAEEKIKRRIEQNKKDLILIPEAHYLLVNETGKLKEVAKQILALIEVRRKENEITKIVVILNKYIKSRNEGKY